MKQIASAVVALIITSSCFAMIPPWHYAQMKLKKTIGLNDCITVGEIQKTEYSNESQQSYELDIIGCTEEMTHALAIIINPDQAFYKINFIYPDGRILDVNSQQPSTQSKDILSALTTIFMNIPYFASINQETPSHIVIKLHSRNISFFCDNLSEPHGLCNLNLVSIFNEEIRSEISGTKITVLEEE